MSLNRTPREYLDQRLAERLLAAGWTREGVRNEVGIQGPYPVSEEWVRHEGARLAWRLWLSWSGDHALSDELHHRPDEHFTSRGLPAALTRRGLLVAPVQRARDALIASAGQPDADPATTGGTDAR
jgi:hypothetical protein